MVLEVALLNCYLGHDIVSQIRPIAKAGTFGPFRLFSDTLSVLVGRIDVGLIAKGQGVQVYDPESF